MNKSNLPAGLSALCAILLIVMLVLQAKQKTNLETLRQGQQEFVAATEQRQQESRESVSKLAGQITNLGASMETRLKESKQQAEAFLTRLQDQGSTNSADMLRGIFQVSYDLRNELTKMRADQIAVSQTNQTLIDDQGKTFQKAIDAISAQVAGWKKDANEMRQQLDDLVNSGALFPDKTKPALEAVALAKTAEQAGDTNLAKVYYLSAVNHAPSEFTHIKNYCDIVFRDPAVTTEDLARLKSVLQISLYQIPPASVTNALALLSETEQRENTLIAANTPKPVPVNWQEQFDRITKAFPLDTAWNDLKKLSKRWTGLNQITDSLREEPSQTNLLEQVENEAELTQNVLTASRLAQVMDTILQSLDASVEQPEKAVSQLQTAEAMLGQLWGIDFNVAGWPEALSDKVDAYPKAIQSYVEIVAEVKSRPFLAKVEAERDSAKSYVDEDNRKSVLAKGHPYQRAITNCDACYERAAAAAQNISSTGGRKKAETDMKTIRDIALDAKRKQFDTYQTWAVKCCKDAFDKYQDTNFTLSPKRLPTWASTLAKDIFDKSSLMKIDQSLLSSETSRLFNDVLGKLTALMNGQGQFDAEKRIAQTAKMKLEDF